MTGILGQVASQDICWKFQWDGKTPTLRATICKALSCRKKDLMLARDEAEKAAKLRKVGIEPSWSRWNIQHFHFLSFMFFLGNSSTSCSILQVGCNKVIRPEIRRENQLVCTRPLVKEWKTSYIQRNDCFTVAGLLNHQQYLVPFLGVMVSSYI